MTPLHINLFVETSPAPVKYAHVAARQVRQHGAAADGAGVARRRKAAVREAMVHAGLIN